MAEAESVAFLALLIKYFGMHSRFPYLFGILLFLSACASAIHDYHDSNPLPERARIYFYRPHALEMMWAAYQISVQGKAVKVLKDEGYFYLDLPPGKVEIQSKHIQDDQIIGLNLSLKANENYYVKLDPDVKKATLLGVLGDVLSIGTVIAGTKSRMKIENGQGDLSDAKNMINGEIAKENLKPQKPFGHHLLLAIREEVARKELADCCSSKAVDDVK